MINRERNRVHARKTRERKKIQMLTLKQRIESLNNEVYLIILTFNINIF